MDHYLKETISTVDKETVSKLNRDLENIDTKQERLIDLYLDAVTAFSTVYFTSKNILVT